MIDFTSDLGKKARKHIDDEYFIWLTTVDSKGAPQTRPVWFIWHDDAFLIYSQAKAYKLKHIRKNPNVSLNFNTSDSIAEEDVLVFNGRAEFAPETPAPHQLPAYMKKYAGGIHSLGSTPEEFSREYSVALRIAPDTIRS